MAGKKKKAEERKEAVLRVRFTEQDFEWLSKMAAELDTDVSKYVRGMVLNRVSEWRKFTAV